MIPGHTDTERIVGRVISLELDVDRWSRVRLCSACYVNFALPVGAEDEAITASHPLAQERCDECGNTIGSKPVTDDFEYYGDDDAWPERPHDTALIGFRSRR